MAVDWSHFGPWSGEVLEALTFGDLKYSNRQGQTQFHAVLPLLKIPLRYQKQCDHGGADEMLVSSEWKVDSNRQDEDVGSASNNAIHMLPFPHQRVSSINNLLQSLRVLLSCALEELTIIKWNESISSSLVFEWGNWRNCTQEYSRK